MSRYTRKHGATLRRPMKPRVSDEQAARLLCFHDDATPAWARAVIDATWIEVRFGFAVALSRGECVAALGAVVTDIDVIPGGRVIEPDGGIIGLSVGREMLRQLAMRWADESVAAATDVDAGPRGVWFLVMLVGRPPCVAKVRVGVLGGQPPREAFTVEPSKAEPAPGTLPPSAIVVDHVRTARAAAGVLGLIERRKLPAAATLADLAGVRRSDLLRLKNFGRVSLEELTALLARAGLAFTPEAPGAFEGGPRHG